MSLLASRPICDEYIHGFQKVCARCIIDRESRDAIRGEGRIGFPSFEPVKSFPRPQRCSATRDCQRKMESSVDVCRSFDGSGSRRCMIRFANIARSNIDNASKTCVFRHKGLRTNEILTKILFRVYFPTLIFRQTFSAFIEFHVEVFTSGRDKR